MKTEIRIGFEATDVKDWMIEGVKSRVELGYFEWDDSKSIPENIFDYLMGYFEGSVEIEDSIGADDLSRLFFLSYERDEAVAHGMNYWRCSFDQNLHWDQVCCLVFDEIKQRFSKPTKDDDFSSIYELLKTEINEVFEHEWYCYVFRDQITKSKHLEQSWSAFKETFEDEFEEWWEVFN